MTKDAQKLKDALSQVAIDYLHRGDLDLASRVTTVANTLSAEPEMLDRLAKILKRTFG